jgi:GT2 family glycosyltransferase
MTADRSAQAGRAADDAGGWQYRLASLRMLATRALASLRRRGLLPTLRIAWRRLRPGVRARFPLVLLGDVASAPAPRFSDSTKPTASIVVPMYDQAAATLRCLHALARSGDACRFELILVDDASGEEAAKELARIAGLRYLRNASNLGFVDSCNAGAAIARGEFLVFLNNDTEVQPGWLDALLRTFRDFPDTGLAGSMLVYPDGRLQEAGGLVYSDGSAGNYGRFADPAHPAFGFVRETGYCSGAALALPRALFESLGGFAAEFRPGYYEDTDLAMRVRERGLAVRYQPASVVVHHEGLSAGTDTGSGMKAYQEINRGKFVQRWQAVLSSAHPPPPRGDEGEVAMSCLASHGRRRILVVDAAVPSPRRDSGSVRMRALMRELVAAGCAVAFTDQFGEYADEDTRALQREGIEAWWEPWRGGLSHWLRQHVVGGGAPADILALANTPGLVLHGQLDALEPLLDDCRLSVAPLRYGAGVKGKVNQAMARGLPVVATSLAAEGMRLQDGREFLLADDAQAFVDAVVRAYQDEALWLRLREGGYANIERWFSPAVARATLLPWLESLPRAGCANAP